MSAKTHPLTLQVQELFTDSDLTPEVTSLLLNELDEYFVSNTLDYSDNLPSVVRNLYEIGDNEMYTIISVCGFNGYEAVLIRPLQHIIKAASQKTIDFLRESGHYEKYALHAEILKVNTLLKTVLELLRNSTRTTRRAIGNGVATEEIEFPDYETLKAFYECGRKVTYESMAEGEAKLEYVNNIYLCVHCNKYHQGQPKVSTAPPVAEEVMLGRYRTAWRRYNKI
jgi:hypothetical protein